DGHVTGVQTCALPILRLTGIGFAGFTFPPVRAAIVAGASATVPGRSSVPSTRIPPENVISASGSEILIGFFSRATPFSIVTPNEIGRASCRERVLDRV